MTKTRPHFTRCIEHFSRGEAEKNEGRCHCQILHHFYGHIFLADERRNEAILGLQKSVQHHLHHCRTNFLKLRQNSSYFKPLLAANELKNILKNSSCCLDFFLKDTRELLSHLGFEANTNGWWAYNLS